MEQKFSISYPVQAETRERFTLTADAYPSIHELIETISIFPKGVVVKIGSHMCDPIFLLIRYHFSMCLMVSNSYEALAQYEEKPYRENTFNPIGSIPNNEEVTWMIELNIRLSDQVEDYRLGGTVHWIVRGDEEHSFQFSEMSWSDSFLVLPSRIWNKFMTHYQHHSVVPVMKGLHELMVFTQAFHGSPREVKSNLLNYLTCDIPSAESRYHLNVERMVSDFDGDQLHSIKLNTSQLERIKASFYSSADTFLKLLLKNAGLDEGAKKSYVAIVDTLTWKSFDITDESGMAPDTNLTISPTYFFLLQELPKNRVFEIHSWKEGDEYTQRVSVMKTARAIFFSDSVPLLYGMLDQYKCNEFLGIGALMDVPVSVRKFRHLVQITKFEENDDGYFYISAYGFDHAGREYVSRIDKIGGSEEFKEVFRQLSNKEVGEFYPSIRRSIDTVHDFYARFIQNEHLGAFETWLNEIVKKK